MSAATAILFPGSLLFAGSGCAALIYEIVWFQLLQLVIGSSAVSLGLLLAAYMGGLCLGSAALPRLVSTRHHPMRVYALLELGIAAFGIIALFGVPLIGAYLRGGRRPNRLGGTGAARRGCGGMPASSYFLDGRLASRHRPLGGNDARGVSWLGLLYSANVAGAVTGCVLAGFYLLRVHDMAFATYIAAAINVAVALLALALARGARAAGRVRMTRNSGVSEARPGRDVRLCRDRIFRTDRAGRRSGVDAAALAAAGRDGLHFLDYSGCVSHRAVGRQRRRFFPGPPGAGSTRWRWPAARSCWPLRSPGPPSRSRTCCPGGLSIRGLP